MTQLAEHDVAATLDLAELVAQRTLKQRHGYLQVDEVAPVLRIALQASVPEVRAKAQRLVHWFGENFSNDFRAVMTLP